MGSSCISEAAEAIPSVTALKYRFLVALVAPLWIVRSATGQMQKRASAISLVVLLVIQAGFQIGMEFFYYGLKWEQICFAYFDIAEQLIFGAGIALALTLYRTAPAVQSV